MLFVIPGIMPFPYPFLSTPGQVKKEERDLKQVSNRLYFSISKFLAHFKASSYNTFFMKTLLITFFGLNCFLFSTLTLHYPHLSYAFIISSFLLSYIYNSSQRPCIIPAMCTWHWKYRVE
jgi:hypothetical protein